MTIRSAFVATVLLAATVSAGALAGFFYPEGATTLHFAFEGSPNGDRPIVRPPSQYYADDGYGFVDSPELTGTAGGVTAPHYFRFDANVPPGNYDVTVRMGGAAEGNVTLRAEAHHVMGYNIAIPARGMVNQSFTVAVLGGKSGEKSMALDNRLTLEISGTNPSMMKLDIKPNTTAPTLWIWGDEASMDHEDLPKTGWGQMLPMFFKAGEVALANAGDDATKAELVRRVKKGDFVLVTAAAPVADAARQQIAARGAEIVTLPVNPNAKGDGAYEAFENAKAVAMSLRDSKSPLAAHLYPDIPALNGDPAQFPASLAAPRPKAGG